MSADRLLPIPVRSLHRETARGYLTRVLATNREPAPRKYVGETEVLEAIVRRTGRNPVHVAGHATGWLEHQGREGCERCIEPIRTRYLCLQCAAGNVIQQHPHFDTLVCIKHNRWVGLGEHTAQRKVGPAHIRAERRFRRLRAANRIDPRLYTLVSSALQDTGASAGDVFPLAIEVITSFTASNRLGRIFSGANTHAERYQALLAWTSGLTSSPDALTRALWTYLRPVFVRRHQAHLGVSLRPVGPHELMPDVAVGEPLDGEIPEPFTGYLRAAGMTRRDADRLSIDHGLFEVHEKSHLLYAGICECGHETEVVRSGIRSDCRTCGPFVVKPGVNDLVTRAPDVAAEWDLESNGRVHPEMVPAGSNKKYWFICPRAAHRYEASPSNRVANKMDCPYCSNRAILVGFNDFKTRHPDLAAEVIDADPTTFTSGSEKDRRWRCSEGHEYYARVAERVRGKGCNVCNVHRLAAGRTNLTQTHPHLVGEWLWSMNRVKRPEHYHAGNRDNMWWMCPNGHTYQQRIDLRAQRGYNCGKCSKRVLAPGENDLATTDAGLITEWHWANPEPAYATKATNEKFRWLCGAAGHETTQTIVHRRKSRGCTECPPEKRILNIVAAAMEAHDAAS